MNFKRFHESKNLTTLTEVTHDGYVKILTPANSHLFDIIEYDTEYTLSWEITSTSTSSVYNQIRFLRSNSTSVKEISNGGSFTLSSTEMSEIVSIAFYFGRNNTNGRMYNFMLNTGSQPLPYEPYSSEVWHDTPHYIHNTSTDTLTTLPADIYANAVTATVGLKGNMSQSSQPSPTTPIQPSECGEMSSNLWSYHPDTTSGGVRLLWDGEKINYSNTCTYASNSIMTINLKKGTYTLKVNANRIPVENDYSCIDIYHPSSGLLKQVTNRNAVNGKVTFTLDDDLSNVSLRIRLDNGTNYDGFEIRPMLNIGETSLPYDVYGQYKIPILSGSTTTNVYLGEVESTRKIKKLVLDGTEDIWTKSSRNAGSFYTNTGLTGAIGDTGICTHLPFISESKYVQGTFTITTASKVLNVWFPQFDANTTINDLKTYLADEYAAGTPVCIWYVLATPETAVVNEPLRKIGDYADEVSGITIPVTAGANTLSIGTTLQPSELTVNYKGWHPVQSVHERENGAWD